MAKLIGGARNCFVVGARPSMVGYGEGVWLGRGLMRRYGFRSGDGSLLKRSSDRGRARQGGLGIGVSRDILGSPGYHINRENKP